jgi:hypothetical protein
MKDTKCLIVTYGFFGDIIFASSIADKLKEEKQFHTIHYLIGFPQMKRLLENNPNIDEVFTSTIPSPLPTNNDIDYGSYDKVIQLKQLSFEMPPPLEFQKYAGVNNPDTKYQTHTETIYDAFCYNYFLENMIDGRKIIAVMRNWKSKTYLFTHEEYDAGIDVPNLGYGGKHRDTDTIIERLSDLYNVVYVGMDKGVTQFDTSILPDEVEGSLLYDCSIMKNCHAFIGTEGGLANLAAGAGTKTIITGDFVYQLYGPNGVLKKIDEPKLGPKYYFPEKGHVTLNPYLTDNEVYESIIQELS